MQREKLIPIKHKLNYANKKEVIFKEQIMASAEMKELIPGKQKLVIYRGRK
jgi:hypothetical protein